MRVVLKEKNPHVFNFNISFSKTALPILELYSSCDRKLQVVLHSKSPGKSRKREEKSERGGRERDVGQPGGWREGEKDKWGSLLFWTSYRRTQVQGIGGGGGLLKNDPGLFICHVGLSFSLSLSRKKEEVEATFHPSRYVIRRLLLT